MLVFKDKELIKIKEDYSKTVFPYYESNISNPKPIGLLSLEQFIRCIKNPKPDIVDLFSKIKQATIDKDLKLKDKLKSQLYYFNPCINNDGLGRSYSNITSFTGLAVLDFDKIDNAEEFKHFLFNALNCIIAAYTSPSRMGCKFIVKIPVCNSIEEFKSYFYGLGFHLEKYGGWDGSAQNCSLPLYLSYDEDLLYREDAETWNIRGEKIDEFKPYDGDIKILENISEKDRTTVTNILYRGLDKITDSGHFLVRSIALAGGGYVASGYFTEGEMIKLLENKMKNIDYLSKNLSGYISTMVQMVRRGSVSPLYLKD